MAIRLFFSDNFYLTKFILYIPILFHLATGIVLLFLVRWNLKIRIGAGLPFLGFCLYIFWTEQPNLLHANTADLDKDEESIRLVTYNVKSYSWGSDRVVDTITDLEPDIFCPIEGTFGTWAPPKVEKALGSEFNWAVGKLLSVASRYPVLESEQLASGNGVRAFRSVIETPSGKVAIIAIDLRTPRQRNDEVAFNRVREILEAETLPAIVTGDFNAPRGSRNLARTTEGWTDVFTEVGTDRYLATWPLIPFPLWQIDHCFCNEGIEPVSASIMNRPASDHLPIVFEFKIRGDNKSAI